MRPTTGFAHEKPIRGETNIWLTPRSIIETLGPFDLDPCAAPEPRPWDTAVVHYTEADNGLTQAWQGYVWCNPPYGEETGIWLSRLAEHNNGVALVFARTDTKWFQTVAEHASLLLFLNGRLAFHRPDGSLDKKAGAPSVLIAFGNHVKKQLRASGFKGIFMEIAK